MGQESGSKSLRWSTGCLGRVFVGKDRREFLKHVYGGALAGFFGVRSVRLREKQDGKIRLFFLHEANESISRDELSVIQLIWR